MSERGFTIVLIDSDDGSEGDFVYVEAFANADAIAAESERVIGSVLAAARGIEARDDLGPATYVDPAVGGNPYP